MYIVISVRGLYKAFTDKEVLAGVNIDVPKGKITSIIGQSGTGKSVLFKCIIGIMHADKGSIKVNGEEITELPEAQLRRIRRHFGYCFQDAALFDSMTVEENIAFPLREVLGIKDKRKMRAIVKEKLEWIGLEGIEQKYPSELSVGMRKRVGVARALAIVSGYTPFVEHTTGWIRSLSEIFNSLIKRVNMNSRITCMVISHDIKGTFAISDQIAFLADGAIQAAGTPAQVARADHPILRKFLENSFANLKIDCGPEE
jgi:phospholipid/cholesterol/gamma-HCH transport system ATP-binding protein